MTEKREYVFPIKEWCQKYGWQYGEYDIFDKHWNFKNAVPVNNLGTFSEGINIYNELKVAVIDWKDKYKPNPIKWTERGYICKDTRSNINYRWYHIESYGISETRALGDITVFSNGLVLRVSIGRDKDDSIGGNKALTILKKELLNDGHNIDDYACVTPQEAEQVKAQIPPPKIEWTNVCKWLKGTDIENVHHIDLNSAYASGIIKAHPELSDTYKRLYANRKKNPLYKDVMNMSIGMMHSQYLHYKYAKLAYDAISYTRSKEEELADKITKNGGTVLNFNTDGIWYQGEMYHDENEGTELGQWKHDYVNVVISFKSPRAYEFTEQDGTYHAIYSGYTSLDREKSRDKWVKGDIYRACGYSLKKTLDKYQTYYWEKDND